MNSYTHIDVEANDNCPMMANQVFKNLSDPVRVTMVRLYEGRPDGELFAVTGWSSAGAGSPTDAYAVEVEDSSAGAAYVIYGGDWGIRLGPVLSPVEEPAGDGDWRLDAPDQWGETHLVLADLDDIVPVSS